jgi:parallel beta-helix repeat protein
VDVGKSVTIESEGGAEVTIVQAADPDDHVFEVTANYVNISGFTVKGAIEASGIYLTSGYSANQCTITFEGNTDYALYLGCQWCGSAGVTICSENNNIWKNNFYDSGVYYEYGGRTNCFSVGVGNYYASSVPLEQVPWELDCGPTPNSDVYVDQIKPTSFEWDASATYAGIQEAIYNTNVKRTIRIVKGTGPYSETIPTTDVMVWILRNRITLDGQGETLKGGPAYGIHIKDKTGVTIKNCIIRDFTYGISLASAKENLLSNNELISNGYGILLSERSQCNTISF